MTIAGGNIFSWKPCDGPDETLTELLSSRDVKIERIVSRAHASPPDFWYDQQWAEWVIVLAGAAALMIEGEAKARTLRPGDFVHIPPHVRHRVAWTDATDVTVWLAVHYREPMDGHAPTA